MRTSRFVIFRAALTVAGALALGLAASAKATAATNYFIGGATGDPSEWTINANWSTGSAPNNSSSSQVVYLGYRTNGQALGTAPDAHVTLTAGDPNSSSPVVYVQSINSAADLTLQIANPNDSSYGPPLTVLSALQFDPHASLTLLDGSTLNFSGGQIYTINANVNVQGVSVVNLTDGTSATLGAGYTWNVTSQLNQSQNSAIESAIPFVDNGTLNLESGSGADFFSPTGTTALTIGAAGTFSSTNAGWSIGSLDNLGVMTISGVGVGPRFGQVQSLTNSGAINISGGAALEVDAFTTAANENQGAITLTGQGSRLVISNLTGNGTINAGAGTQLALDNLNASEVGNITVASGAAVALGGTITTAAGQTFDYTKLGSDVSFGIPNIDSRLSFTGGTVLHSENLDNLYGLTNVSFDHGLNLINNNPAGNETRIYGTVNAGNAPVAIDTAYATLNIEPGATLNGAVALTQQTQNLNINNAAVTGPITAPNGGHVTVQGNTSSFTSITLGANSDLTLTGATISSGTIVDSAGTGTYSTVNLGNTSFGAGVNATLGGGVIYTSGNWTNAGHVTFAPTTFLQNADPNYASTLTNTGVLALTPGGSVTDFFGAPARPIDNLGTLHLTPNSLWSNQAGTGQPSDVQTVNNSGLLQIDSGAKASYWAVNQTAGSTVLNGTLFVDPSQNSGALGVANVQGGTLTGNGSFDGYAVTIAGTVAPGATANPGSLHFINSTLALTSRSLLSLQAFSPSDYSSLLFSGANSAVSLNGALRLQLLPGAQFSSGDILTLISGASVSGRFSSVQLPAGWAIQYSGTSVNVVAAPEPPTLPAMLGAGLILLWKRRRTKRFSAA